MTHSPRNGTTTTQTSQPPGEDISTINAKKRVIRDALKHAACLLNGAPDFDNPDVMKAWGGHLYPHWGEELATVLVTVHHRWKFWPSMLELLEAAGIDLPSPENAVEKAINSIWSHLDTRGPMTTLGQRVFDSLGGWEIIGQQATVENRRHWQGRFRERAKELIKKDKSLVQNKPDLNRLALSGEVEQDPQRRISDLDAYLQKKCNETHELIHRPILECEETYEERRQKAMESGSDYWEPPRSWEIGDRKLTPKERLNWMRKIREQMKKNGVGGVFDGACGSDHRHAEDGGEESAEAICGCGGLESEALRAS